MTERPATPEATVPRDAESSPLAFLVPTLYQVDDVLAELPASRLEARRVITREWGLDPTPSELQTIVRVAHDPSAQRGVQRELARAALAARVFVDRELRRLLDCMPLDAARIRETAETLPELSKAVEALDDQLRSIGETAAPAERSFLQEIGRTLIPIHGALVAAGVIAPHLERLAAAEGEDEIRSVLPCLADSQVTMLASVASPEPEPDREPARSSSPSRLCVDAAVLSAVIRSDLALLNQEGEADAFVEPQELLERMTRDKVAYHVVAGRLKQQQDTALLARLTDYAESLGTAQHNLVAAYQEMTAALSAAAPEPAGGVDGAGGIVNDLLHLLEESAAQDALADSQWSQRVTPEELYVDALKGVRPPQVTASPVFAPTYDPKRERLRIRVLSLIAAILFAGCLGVWATRLGREADPTAVPLTKMSDTLILDKAISIGPMMYAVVSHWSWDNLSNDERLGSVRALGLSAANAGFDTVYLVDESNEELAMWSKDHGAKLMGPKASGEPADRS
jgi:hypothetical protein